MVERRAYVCDEAGCEAYFPVDDNDPMVAHGQYLDHQAEHDAELEAADPEPVRPPNPLNIPAPMPGRPPGRYCTCTVVWLAGELVDDVDPDCRIHGEQADPEPVYDTPTITPEWTI